MVCATKNFIGLFYACRVGKKVTTRPRAGSKFAKNIRTIDTRSDEMLVGYEIFVRGEAAIRHRGKERNDGNSAFARERTSMLQPNTGTARL
jgi:hypothetical protein